MGMHKIEVDDEVFEYLKSRAEPFVDTPNSTLRRELLGGKPGRVVKPTISKHSIPMETLPMVPSGTPKALEEILQVSYLVHRSGLSRRDATHHVAHKHGIAIQTVLDKYCRQLGLTADKFDELLGRDDLRDLKAVLRRKFSSYAGFIDEYLGENGGPGSGNASTNG